MNYLGEYNKVVDGAKRENLDQRIFEFNLKPDKEDYFLNYFLNWDRVVGDVYTLKIGGHTFQIGAGLYVFVGCEDADGDWAIIDEIIGRDIQIFMTTPNMTSWSFEEPSLLGINSNGGYYFPSSRNPIPVVSNDGEAIIMVSVVDQYRSHKGRDHLALFIL
jgi:hypothetical protein